MKRSARHGCIALLAFLCGYAGAQELVIVADRGDAPKVQALLAKGADVNARNKYGITALMKAASNGHIDVVQALLAKGADVNAKDRTGETALMHAAFFSGRLDVVQALIAKGADVNARNEYNATALSKAASSGYLEVAQALVANGAEVNGGRALMSAARNGHLDVAQLLIAKGADVNAKAGNGTTALIEAASSGHLDVVRTLLAKGAEVNAVNLAGTTAVDLAASQGHAGVAAILIECGADIHLVKGTTDDYYATALIHELGAMRAGTRGQQDEEMRYYRVAADYYEKAAVFYGDSSRKLARNRIWQGVAQGLAAGLGQLQGQMQANQMAQISALQTASAQGTGIAGYQSALQAQTSIAPNNIYPIAATNAAATSATDQEELLRALAKELHAKSVKCLHGAQCYENSAKADLKSCLAEPL